MTSAAVKGQVLEANRRFYEAFEALSLDAMEACCDTGERASCLHPGGVWLRGWDEVREAWKVLFANTSYIEFELDDLHVEVLDPVGWVTCVERVRTAGGPEPATVDVAATNVFLLDEQGWRLVVHHASPVVGPAGGGG